MTHHEKLQLFKRHMATVGVSPMTASPPAWRLMWRFGIQASPPLFASFSSLALATGLFFGAFWGLCMWIFYWSRHGFSISAAVISAILAGVFFGLTMAAYYRYLRRKHNLPSWDSYSGQP